MGMMDDHTTHGPDFGRPTLNETCVCGHPLARHPQHYECLECAETVTAWPCGIFVSLADARRADAAPGKKWEPLP